MSKQDKVVEMVKAGKYTRQEIIEAVECTSGALASYMSGMRNAAKYTGDAICPVTDDDGIFSVITFAEWEAAKEEKKAAATTKRESAKTPEERLEAAEKRVTRCRNQAEKAYDRFMANDENRILELRSDKAAIELEIAQIELDALQVALSDVSTEEESDTPALEEDELL